jgi:hypothetical protein
VRGKDMKEITFVKKIFSVSTIKIQRWCDHCGKKLFEVNIDYKLFKFNFKFRYLCNKCFDELSNYFIKNLTQND